MSLSTGLLKEKWATSGRVIGLQALAFALGFFTARTELFDKYTPLGVAITAGAPPEATFTAAAGALVGYLIPFGGESHMGAMGAVALTALLCWLIRGYFPPSMRSSGSALFAGGSYALLLTVLAIAGEHTDSVMAITGEVLLTAGGAYFFYEFFQSVTDNTATPHSSKQIACGGVALTLLLTAFMDFTFMDFTPARLIGILAVLYAARYGKESGGAIAGISVGFGVYLALPDLPQVALAIALSGLIAGLFAPLGKIGCAVSFIITNGLVVIANMNYDTLPYLYEVMIATSVYVLLPTTLGQPVGKLFAPPPEGSLVAGLRNTVVLRLQFAAEAVQNVSQTVEEVSHKLKRLDAPNFEQIFEKTEQTACVGCGLRMYCWETNRGNTLAALLAGIKGLRQEGTLAMEDFPEDFTNSCQHPDRMVEVLAKEFGDFIARDAAGRRLEEIQGVIAEQFAGVSQMLSGLSEEFKTARRYDYATAGLMEELLSHMEVTPTDLCCQEDEYGRLTAEIRLDAQNAKLVNRAALLRQLNAKCNREFEIPTITETDRATLITLTEKAGLTVDFGVAQASYGKNKLCGDAYQGFFDGRGRFVMMISDGMGKGGRAAVDGAMASGLMAQLMKAGFDPQSALKMVNSAMMYKSTEESLATVDVTVLDLFSGCTECYKAGAPATLLRRGGTAGSAGGDALPAGIVNGVEFSCQQVTLSAGDIIVMMSDGAVGDGIDWMGVELETWKYGTATNLAEHLVDYARRRWQPGQEDDITVAVAIIEKGY